MDKTDNILIQESLSGSMGAFDDLMERYQGLVYKVALRYGERREHALDITQNVFLRVYEKLDSLRADASFKPWLLRITYHESINWLRKQRQYQDHEPVDENAPLPGRTRTQEEALLRQEKTECLTRSLSCLNPKHRLAVTLKYYEGMSIREISAVLECSEMMVKNILYRSLEKLRQRLVQTGGVVQ